MNENFSASEINSCICLASKRQSGLIKLSEYLNKCSSLVIEEHGIFWLKTLLQIIEVLKLALSLNMAKKFPILFLF
jgi:hypothetical protein